MKNTLHARRPETAGFTLVELLVVVAILGVLAALALPGMARARAAALNVKAIGNMRQLVTAENLYKADNNGNYTAIYATDPTTLWPGRLFPYLGINYASNDMGAMTKMFASPQCIFNVPESSAAALKATVRARSIGLNYFISNPAWNYRALAVPNQSQYILLGETGEENGETVSGATIGSPSGPAFRRDGGKRSLVALCDGHTEALSAVELSLDASVRPAGAPNRWRWDQ